MPILPKASGWYHVSPAHIPPVNTYCIHQPLPSMLSTSLCWHASFSNEHIKIKPIKTLFCPPSFLSITLHNFFSFLLLKTNSPQMCLHCIIFVSPWFIFTHVRMVSHLFTSLEPFFQVFLSLDWWILKDTLLIVCTALWHVETSQNLHKILFHPLTSRPSVSAFLPSLWLFLLSFLYKGLLLLPLEIFLSSPIL